MNKSKTTPKGWLAFELNVLRRLKFESAILPFNADANLGSYLKRWSVRVLANDPNQYAWTNIFKVLVYILIKFNFKV